MLKDNDLGRVGLLVFELGNLISDLLLAYNAVRSVGFNYMVRLTITAGLDGSLNVADTLDSHAVLIIAVDILVLKLTNLIDQHTELVGDIGYVIITSLAPDGQLLLFIVNMKLERSGLSQAYSNLHALS